MKSLSEKQPVKVQLYPYLDSVHAAYNSLVSCPPESYIFVGSTDSKKKAFMDKIKKNKIIKKLYKTFISLFKTVKISESFNQEKEVADARLVYSFGMFYKGDKPFIVDLLDVPASLTGNSYELLIKNKKYVEEYLSKNNCKKIICPHEAILNFMKKTFNKKITKKLILLRQAVKPVDFSVDKDKFKKNKRIKLLFMGSLTNPGDFYMKGGLEVILTFKELVKKYDVELVMRSLIPPKVKEFIKGTKNITLLEERLPFEDIVKLYSSSDILLMPYHQYILMVTLESMYFGLPIVTTDSYAVKYFIKNNYNGFIVPHSKKLDFGYNHPSYPEIIRSSKFIDALWDFDYSYINRLAEKVELLIKNPELRKKMGENGRKIVQQKFSIERRNKELKQLFDGILNGKI